MHIFYDNFHPWLVLCTVYTPLYNTERTLEHSQMCILLHDWCLCTYKYVNLWKPMQYKIQHYYVFATRIPRLWHRNIFYRTNSCSTVYVYVCCFNIHYYKNIIFLWKTYRIQLCDIPLLNIHRDTAYDVSFVSTYKEEGGLEDGGGGWPDG